MGAFMGTAGIVYTLAQVGRVLGEGTLTTCAFDGLDLLDQMIDEDTLFDLIGGTSGVLAVALAMHDLAADASQRATALAVADSAYCHLAAKLPALNGSQGEETVFSGFAHGVAGVYPYLARFAQLTGDNPPDRDVDSLLAVQDDMFDRSDSDWYTSTQRRQKSHGWCHGAPGILLGLCLLENERTGRDLTHPISMAKERTVQHGFGNNITYCHGDFGNLEILRFCAQVNDDAELRSQVDAASSALFRIYVDEYRHRSDCKHLYSNSLLVGTSGIGFALLRSIEEKRVPPLLWLT
jgi:lantibiotic modifying enzyme